MSKTIKCPDCEGSGQVLDSAGEYDYDCPECNGEGTIEVDGEEDDE